VGENAERRDGAGHRQTHGAFEPARRKQRIGVNQWREVAQQHVVQVQMLALLTLEARIEDWAATRRQA
jgi:hypothetical protein